MGLFVDIEKRLGDFRLKVRFEAENEVLALLGASGCGKSMTLKCIAGIEKPDKGRVVLDGKALFDSEKGINLPPQKRRVGYLFQQYALFPNMTVRQNMLAGIRGKENREEKVKRMVKAMRLEGMENKRPHQLSGGQQQRVALARILLNEPELLLLDEPFSALDSHLRFRLEQEMREVLHRFDKTVLLVSHNRDEVFRLSDAVAIMNGGRIETIGKRADVFHTPKTRNGAILTGCKNISPIRKLDRTRVLALDWNMELNVNDGDALESASFIGIRLHDIALKSEETNHFSCMVTEVIENPFSYTVMLKRADSPGMADIGFETSKEKWQAIKADYLNITLPPENILLLRE
jgi:ABC-type sulfate/molybdate transport systems, ATPase component